MTKPEFTHEPSNQVASIGLGDTSTNGRRDRLPIFMTWPSRSEFTLSKYILVWVNTFYVNRDAQVNPLALVMLDYISAMRRCTQMPVRHVLNAYAGIYYIIPADGWT
jgi:hypothetical protein